MFTWLENSMHQNKRKGLKKNSFHKNVGAALKGKALVCLSIYLGLNHLEVNVNSPEI